MAIRSAALALVASAALLAGCTPANQPQATEAADIGIMSTDQLEYLYSYFTERLVPCLELMGYAVDTAPTHDSFLFSAPYLSWAPYWSMSPQPQSGVEWERVDARCPPSPLGTFSREAVG